MKLKYGLFIFILATILLIIGGALAYFIDDISYMINYLCIWKLFTVKEEELSMSVVILRGAASILYWIGLIYLIFFWTFFFDTIFAKNKLIIEDLKRTSFK